jgi:hypothetical protein
MSLIRTPSPSPYRGYTAFGCLDFAPDIRGQARDPVLTGVACCPDPVPLADFASLQCRVALLQSAAGDPVAAFAEDAGDVRFYFLVNLLDRECRSLLERSTSQGTLQMLLTSPAGSLPRGFRMEQPFLEPLAQTAGRAHRPFDAWLRMCVQLAPELPTLLTHEHTDRPVPSTHCAVIMLPPSRWGDADALLDELVG